MINLSIFYILNRWWGQSINILKFIDKGEIDRLDFKWK